MALLVILTRVWAKDQPFGAELADLTLADGILSASGVAIGTKPGPYRLDFELTTTRDYVTARLSVRSMGSRLAARPGPGAGSLRRVVADHRSRG